MEDYDSTVFVVEDDEAVRDALSMLVETVGLKCRTYQTAQDFLADYDPSEPGCLVADVRMPGMSGLELQAKLAKDGIEIPIVIITGHGDVHMAVKALKTGAVDFVQKPFRDHTLLNSILKAVVVDSRKRRKSVERSQLDAKLAELTSREREVMDLLVMGKSTREVARDLDISSKTVDIHRRRVLDKMEVRSVVELVLATEQLRD